MAERHCPVPQESKKFDGIGLIIDLERLPRIINYRFLIASGKQARLREVEEAPNMFEVQMQIKNDGQWATAFTFYNGKRMCQIGKTKADNALSCMIDEFEAHGSAPQQAGKNTKEKVKNLANALRMTKHWVDMQTKRDDWGTWEEAHPDEVSEEKEPKQTWAEASGGMEEFDGDIKIKAEEILGEENLLEEMMNLAELKVVQQRPKVGLTAMMAMTSFMQTSIHNIIQGPPGTGKSAITEVVFEMFPKQRKEAMGKSTTPASLLNMTKYAEGSMVLAKKLIKLGDLGNEEELKNCAEFLGIIREVMSEGSFDKNVTNTKNDENITQKLRLLGVGSVQLSTIESNVESQYGSRCIISSPDDNPEIKASIKAHQLDDYGKKRKEAKFNKLRPAVACAINMVADIIDELEVENQVDFINPYAEDLDEILGISNGKNENRNRQNIIELAKAITLCNVKTRDKYIDVENNSIMLVMTPDDYVCALKIMGRPIKQMLSNVSPQFQSYVRYFSDKCEFDIDGNTVNFMTWAEFNGLTELKWDKAVKEQPHLTKRQVMEGLGTGKTTTTNILEQLISKKILFKKLYGGRNLYFPTESFHSYSEYMALPLLKDEELKEGSERYDWAEIKYKEQLKRMEKDGYEKMD